jgi:hypothetical protein
VKLMRFLLCCFFMVDQSSNIELLKKERIFL